jgi:hypothetical protein
MKPPESLPGLFAYDTRKRRLTARSQLGYMLRAAALADLLLRGNLVDETGKAQAGTPPQPLDPVLDGVLSQVAGAPPRKWQHWVRKDHRAAVHAVRDQLEADRMIKVARHRILGVFPATRITLSPHVATRLANRVNGAVRGSQPLSRVDPHDAALVALVTTGGLKIVLSPAQRLRSKAWIAQLTESSGPIPPALRNVIRNAPAAASGG